MERAKIRFSVSLLVAAMFALAGAHLSGDTTRDSVVTCDSPGTNLQTKLDNAVAGSTIYIRGTCSNGLYRIGKNLTLAGQPAATLAAPNGGPVVLQIEGAKVQLRDLTIDGTNNDYALRAISGASITMERVTVHDARGPGVAVDFNSHADILRSNVGNNGFGVMVTASSSAYLAENTIQSNQFGVYVQLNSSANANLNTISNNRVGVLVSLVSSLVLTSNTIESNTEKGVWIAHQYGFLATTPNTIQYNGVDVTCGDRGIYEGAPGTISETKTADISPGCVLLDPIFQQ